MQMKLNQYQISAQTDKFELELAKDRKYVGCWSKERGTAFSTYLLVWENTETPVETVQFAVMTPSQTVDASNIEYRPIDFFPIRHNLAVSVVFELGEYNQQRKLGKS